MVVKLVYSASSSEVVVNFFYQGNCLVAEEYRNKFESLVSELGCQFIRRDIYVPSFHEMYPHCQIQL